MQKYRVFKRSATCFEDLRRSGQRIRGGLTIEEARQLCRNFNDNRTDAQIRAGTKYEFTAEGHKS